MFENSLDPDQAEQNIGPDFVPICLTQCGIPEIHFEKIDVLEKKVDEKACRNYLACKERVHHFFAKLHHSGKSATIRESNHGSGVCMEHYA